jgi:hypothetical protein
MAPIRRYLRITKYSVLECRIYLDNPALVHAWLLNPSNPVLPRVIESIRPLVLPKLREERERERNRKSKKVRSIKDVVIEGAFTRFTLTHTGGLALHARFFTLSDVIQTSGVRGLIPFRNGTKNGRPGQDAQTVRLILAGRRLRGVHLSDRDTDAALAAVQEQTLPRQDADQAHVQLEQADRRLN